MFGSSRFKHLWGNFREIGVLATTELALSAADSAVGTIKQGKLVAYKDNSDTLMKYAVGAACLGFLRDFVNLAGTTDVTGFKDYTIGKLNIPKKRGGTVSIMVPDVGSIWELEGAGGLTVDNLIATTGTGAIAANSTLYSYLSVTNGCLRLAQADEVAVARLLRANLTPENASEIRIRIQWLGTGYTMPSA